MLSIEILFYSVKVHDTLEYDVKNTWQGGN